MIVRIAGEGQFSLPDEDAGRLNELDNRAEEELSEVHQPAVDVAADEVAVSPLDIRGAERAPREDQIAEARSEALDLRLHPLGHVLRRAVRDMAVGPGGVLPGGSTRVVEE